MFTSENVLSAEFITEKTIKVTHKEGNDVLVTNIQKNPRKESYKSLIESGWSLQKIKERTKELQSIEDPSVRLVEKIAGGYSWAVSQLKDKQAQFDDLKSQLKDLYQEQKDVMSNLQDLYQEQQQAARTLNDLYQEQQHASSTLGELYQEQQHASSTLGELYQEQQHASSTLGELYQEQQNAAGTLGELYQEQQQASGTLGELYQEQQQASGTLGELYKEQQQASESLADLYDEHSKATQELEIERTELKKDVETERIDLNTGLKKDFVARMDEMKERMQQNYDKYQQLYGMNIFDTIFNEDADKETLFKSKLEILAKPQLKNSDKSFKSKVRKAKDVNSLIKLVLNELETLKK
jgi:septation ring formation regulator EzrA